MDVLISWSKSQSKEVATALYGWLPKVVPGIKPWMSSEDIDKGKRWFAELQGALHEATSCVICVTEENARSPWIYYATGAIAAKKDSVLICPYLLGIGVGMLTDGPLGQYQCTVSTKHDTLQLIKSLNRALPAAHDTGLIVGNFEIKWPEFERELRRAESTIAAPADDFVETDADVLAGFKLSPEARATLIAAAESNGDVLLVRDSGGTHIHAGRQLLNDPADRRSVAVWERAISDLVGFGLLTARGYKGQVFQITAKGYEVADLLHSRV